MMKLNLRVHDGCPSGHRAFHSGTSSVIMPPSTGPLDALRDKHGLVLVDVANLFCGATRAGCELSFEMLASLLRASLRVADLHAFFARNTRNPGLENSFRASGYRAHQRDVEYVATVKGMARKSNCDNDILFTAGAMVATNDYEVVVVGTGDGDLASDLARGVHKLWSGTSVITLSFAHSTAWRLHSDANPAIAGNILIGADCVRRVTSEMSPTTSPFTRRLATGGARW